MNVVPIILSSQQQAVIDWVLEDKGSLELDAKAGCGKTFTLLRVIDTIVKYRMGDIAIMAYNKKIADEIKGKLEKAGYSWKDAQAGTVHSFGFSAWRKVAPNVKVDQDKIWNIIRRLDLEQQTKFHENNGSSLAKLVSLAKQKAVGHIGHIKDDKIWFDIWDHFGLEDDVTEDINPEELIHKAQEIYKISLDTCREIIDFDDMILAPLFHKAKFWPKRWVLVDESQDTNPARRALAMAILKPKIGRMIFVGDPAQAIYGFTGADSDSMNQLKMATNAKTLPLNVTRRCPKSVVKMAQRLIPDFVAHEDAPEGTVRSAKYEDLLKENLAYEDVILCRNTAPLIQAAYLLLRNGIGCRVEGRDIGNGLIKLARRWKIKTLDQLLVKLDDYQDRETAKYMSKNQENKVEALVDKLDCLRIIINRCTARKQHNIDDLVADISDMFGDTKEGEQPSVLTLSTVHKSKGREWKRVFILGRSKYMPSPYAKKDWQMQQELNLEYVAITRAISELIDVQMPDIKTHPQLG